MTKLTMKLFVTGRTVRSDAAIENLHTVLNELVPDNFELTIIDVLENPQAADDNFILATPTLLRIKPLPSRKIIGDLSNKKLLVDSLDLSMYLTH